MADNSEVIRSFLVSVGVQSDEKGLKRFDDTVKGISKNVAEFAKALGAAAVAAGAAVGKVSEEFEGLYYASQRVRSSVDNIKAFSFGISQMGGSAKEAMASLEAFGAFMRSNPAGEGVVRMMGVQTRDAAGNLREYADVLRDVGAQFRKMPYWAAKQRADMLGIDEKTLQALLRGTDLWSDRYKKMVTQSGVNMQKMAEDATNFMQGLRLLRAELEIYFYKALQSVNPEVLRLSVVLGLAAAAFLAVSVVLDPVVAGVLALGAAFVLLWNDYQGWKDGADSLINWKEWSEQIENAEKALGDLAAAFSGLGDALHPIGNAFVEAFGPLVNLTIHAVTQLVHDLTYSVIALRQALSGDWKGAWGTLKQGAAVFVQDTKDQMALAGKVGQAAASGYNKPAAANQNTPSAQSNKDRAMSYFMRQGWTKEQAAGIVAGAFAESSLNADATNSKSGAFGIGQWLGPRKKALFAKYGPNPTFDQQMEFLQSELMGGDKGGASVRRQTTAEGTASAYISDFMRPAQGAETQGDFDRAGAFLSSTRLDGGGGNRTVTLDSKTNITVNGGSQETARAVGAAVDNSNAKLARNTQAVMR